MPTLEIRRPTPFVAEVWLDRPEVRNAFNSELIAGLQQAFRELVADERLRVIVLVCVTAGVVENSTHVGFLRDEDLTCRGPQTVRLAAPADQSCCSTHSWCR